MESFFSFKELKFEEPYLEKYTPDNHASWDNTIERGLSLKWSGIKKNENPKKVQWFFSYKVTVMKWRISWESSMIKSNATHHHSLGIHLCQVASNFKISRIKFFWGCEWIPWKEKFKSKRWKIISQEIILG